MKHVIPTVPSETFPDNPNFFSSPRNFEIRFTDNPTPYKQYSSFSIFGWNEKNAARVVHGGPIVQGPYASISENGVMLTAHKQEPKEFIKISIHDTLEIDGVEYSMKLNRYGYFTLIPV
jgi:hypothetical protein